MIIKKSYLKQYFNILQEKLKINVELNNGSSKEGFTIEDGELISDSDENNLFADNRSDNISNSNENVKNLEEMDYKKNNLSMEGNQIDYNNDIDNYNVSEEVLLNNRFLNNEINN